MPSPAAAAEHLDLELQSQLDHRVERRNMVQELQRRPVGGHEPVADAAAASIPAPADRARVPLHAPVLTAPGVPTREEVRLAIVVAVEQMLGGRKQLLEVERAVSLQPPDHLYDEPRWPRNGEPVVTSVRQLGLARGRVRPAAQPRRSRNYRRARERWRAG